MLTIRHVPTVNTHMQSACFASFTFTEEEEGHGFGLDTPLWSTPLQIFSVCLKCKTDVLTAPPACAETARVEECVCVCARLSKTCYRNEKTQRAMH